jgi:hypothetical protein
MRHPGRGADVTEYLIAFNYEWVPDHTAEELREKSEAVGALVAEMKGGRRLHLHRRPGRR